MRGMEPMLSALQGDRFWCMLPLDLDALVWRYVGEWVGLAPETLKGSCGGTKLEFVGGDTLAVLKNELGSLAGLPCWWKVWVLTLPGRRAVAE